MKPCWLTKRRAVLLVAAILLVIPPALFVINGTMLAYGETPVLGRTAHPPAELVESRKSAEITIVAFNIAKCFAYKGGLDFESTAVVRNRLSEVAQVVRSVDPDLVFLSETVLECPLCAVNQVAELADATGMHAWAFGENFSLGLPFCKFIAGNAILSRWPLEPVANIPLAGQKPFYVAKNNRRLLCCRLRLGDTSIVLASVHTDSTSPDNNLAQTKQILEYFDGRPAILAGDFNAQPFQPSIQLIQRSGDFSGEVDGSLTYPAQRPNRRIDYIFAPAPWTLLECKTLDTKVSDHLPVVARFKVPAAGQEVSLK